jgi:hypothetical protein
MSTEFTVTVTTVIEGEMHTFERTWPIANEMARKAVGMEVQMILEEHYGLYKSANLIMRGNPNIEEE